VPDRRHTEASGSARRSVQHLCIMVLCCSSALRRITTFVSRIW
jgi:hypothetical protein